MSDIVFYHAGGPIQEATEPSGWYFWDETWAGYVGPYDSQEIAEEKATSYGNSL